MNSKFILKSVDYFFISVVIIFIILPVSRVFSCFINHTLQDILIIILYALVSISIIYSGYYLKKLVYYMNGYKVLTMESLNRFWILGFGIMAYGLLGIGSDTNIFLFNGNMSQKLDFSFSEYGFVCMVVGLMCIVIGETFKIVVAQVDQHQL